MLNSAKSQSGNAVSDDRKLDEVMKRAEANYRHLELLRERLEVITARLIGPFPEKGEASQAVQSDDGVIGSLQRLNNSIDREARGINDLLDHLAAI